ncbi:MAG: prolipoprotein diacylglyceryl transferase [bacterium]
MNHEIFKPLYEIFGLPYPGAYMSMLFLGFACAFPIAAITAKKQSLSIWKQLILPVVIVPVSLVFSRIFHVLFDENFTNYMTNLKEEGISYLFAVLLNPFGPGHVFYGGLLGGFLAGAAVTLINYPKNKKAFLQTADAASIVVANGLWLARIGCFFQGCCFGIPSNLFGIRFPQGSPTMFLLYKIDPENTSLFTATQKIIPTQLIHAVSNFAILLILINILFFKKESKPGYVASVFLILYSITRFLIEFLRYDIRGSFLFLSTSQWISIFVLIGGWKLYKMTKVAKKS